MRYLYQSLFITILVSLSFSSLKAQAPDWTKYDCNNKSWNLYKQLDSNQVVAMLFGMGCSSCTDADGFFTGLRHQYDATYPGRFKAFYMDFWGNTCGGTVINSGLNATFDSCQAELSVYTSAMPMTYLVIAAGPSHSVIYSFNKKFIFEFADTSAIKTTIENYLNAVGVKEIKTQKNQVSVYPNPASDKLFISNNSKESYSMKLYDLKGLVVKDVFIENKESLLNIESLPAGEYVLKFRFGSGKTETQKILKN